MYLLTAAQLEKASGTTEIRSFHLNPETGTGFHIADVFNHDLNSLEDVSKLVRETVYDDPQLADYLFPGRITDSDGTNLG